jgi:UDP-2,4-diacetamido-2,4,6-trideoxy-beta-L-altropyranose hydrolase
MNLYIRADADSKIGTGHVMRCIALAQAWQDQGNKVTFISHCESKALRERIKIEGCRFISLDHVFPDSCDLTSTLSILKNECECADQKKWLVLDGYHFTPEYQRAIRDMGSRLLVIDDMNHLPYYYADILLNQNIHAPDLKYHCDKDTTLLLGARYVLLRREFLKYQNFKRQIPDRAKNILVTLGGADPDNVTLKVIEALKLLDDSAIEAKIVIGPANPYRELLSDALTSSHFVSHLLSNPLMPDLMAWADLAISAGGSTCWELAYLGVPFLAIILAENQRSIVISLDTKKVAINCGDGNEITTVNFSKIFSNILCNREARSFMSSQGTQLNDGNGSMRVYSSLMH